MQAIVISAYGGPEQLTYTEHDDPLVGPDGILVEVRAAGVNPVDWKIREGGMAGAYPSHLPMVLGWDVAGVVREVGTAVHEWAAGDEVIGYVREDHIQRGTYAELVAARPRHLAPKPRSVDFTTAAGLPLAGLTALQSLELSGVGDGDVALVHAASGGVGHFAVQLARARGATVIGTASPRHHDDLRELGAVPVAYGDGLADRVREMAPGPVTTSNDYVGTDESFAVTAELVDDPSRIVANVRPAAVAEIGGRHAFVRPDAGQLAELSQMVDAGELRIDVQQVLPLEDAAKAHEISRDGHVRGKLVLAVS